MGNETQGTFARLSAPELIIGLVLVGAYCGLITGLTAALYNCLIREAKV